MSVSVLGITALVIRHVNGIFFSAVFYCYMWPVWIYHVFLRYLINVKISEKKIKHDMLPHLFNEVFY
jgi:hypothetical protein